MTFDVAKQTIDYIFNEPGLESDEIALDFIGGEPLLEIVLIDKIIDYFILIADSLNHHWRDDFKIRITTNGLLYSSDKVQKFISKYHKHLGISISIDGDKTKTNTARVYPNGAGSYDDVVKSIPLWREQFPEEGTKMTISHDDLPFVFEGVKHLVALGIHKIDVNPVLENVWRPNDNIILEDQLIKCADFLIDNKLNNIVELSCFNYQLGNEVMPNTPYNYGTCGSFAFTVDYKGDFYKCLRFAKFSLRNQKARTIGNIDKGIDWNRLRPFQTYCNQITSPKCIHCELQNGCKICPAENYDSSSSFTIFEQSYSSCLMHIAKVRAKNYYWNKLFSLTQL